jgi:hypothetical protein
MKRIIVNLLILFSFSFFTGCNSTNETKEENIPGMHRLDLNRYGKPFSILVPDTTKNDFKITEQPNGALEIRSGKNFGISIYEQEADINLKKEDLKADEINKFKQYIKDEPNGIIWESQVIDPEFHFLVNTKIGNSVYSFEEIKETQGNGYSREAVTKMYDSAISIKEQHKS